MAEGAARFSTKRRRRRFRSTKTPTSPKTTRLQVPLPRSAPAAAAAQHRPAPSKSRWQRGSISTTQGFLEIETPILTQVDAGRRARLPRAEPRPPGRVLRAAAVAADLQADPDDRRASTATSRSRAASATRTCAPIASPSSRRSTSRCRSRREDARVRRSSRARSRRCSAASASTVPRRRSRACRTPRRWRSTDRTSPICGSAGDQRL